MGATNSVVAGASGGGKTAEMPGQMPPVKGGGGSLADLLPQLEGIMTALKALVEKLGGGAAAAVAGASGDVAAGGPPKDAKSGATEVANANGGPGQHAPTQVPTQAPPAKVAGDSGPGDKGLASLVAQSNALVKQLEPLGGKVAGDFGPGQFPGQFPTQVPTKVAGDFGPGGKVTQTDVGGVFQHGHGHQLRRGIGHLRHMGPFQFPGQFPGQFPAPVKAPVTQVAGNSGPGKVEQAPVKAPVTQVAGDSGPGKVEQAPVKVEAPVTQVAGDSGPGKVEQAPVKVEPAKSEPTQSEPTQSAPVQSPPVTQVAGDSGSEPKTPVVEQSPSQPTQAPAQKAPVVGDVKMIEHDHGNTMQLLADDGSHLFFVDNTVSYKPRTGAARTLELPATGFAVTLSDGTKVSYGLHEQNLWGEDAGTPRDFEVIASDGELYATRTDDGQNEFGSDGFGVTTPLTSFNLLEVASMLFDGSYSKFGSSGEVVQQSGNVVQQTAK